MGQFILPEFYFSRDTGKENLRFKYMQSCKRVCVALMLSYCENHSLKIFQIMNFKFPFLPIQE